jgi:hypothetical protein
VLSCVTSLETYNATCSELVLAYRELDASEIERVRSDWVPGLELVRTSNWIRDIFQSTPTLLPDWLPYPEVDHKLLGLPIRM